MFQGDDVTKKVKVLSGGENPFGHDKIIARAS
jgi:hypothetical protein